MEKLPRIDSIQDKIRGIYNALQDLGGSYTKDILVSLEEDTEEISNYNLLVLVREISSNLQDNPSILNTEDDFDKLGLHAEILKIRSALEDTMNEFLDNDILDILKPGTLKELRPKLYSLFDLIELPQQKLDKVKNDLDNFQKGSGIKLGENQAYMMYFNWLIDQYGQHQEATLEQIFLVYRKSIQSYTNQFKAIIPLLFDKYDKNTLNERLEVYIEFVYNFSVNYKRLKSFAI